MKYLSMSFVFLFFSIVNAQNLVKPIYSLKKASFFDLEATSDRVIHETQNHYILKSPMADFSKNEYFYVQLNPQMKDLRWLSQLGEIITYQEGEFAVFSPKDLKALEKASHILHQWGNQCGTLQKLSPMAISSVSEPRFPVIKNKPSISQAIQQADYQNIVESVKTMVSWKTRYHADSEGQFTAQKLKDLYLNVLPKSRQDVEIELFKHSGTKQDSLIVRIPGTQSPDEIVILGSHLDSLNDSDSKNAPGADDNASGTSTNLEVFRVLMAENFFPKKTIEIHAYGAEEIGLVGSGEIADQYKSSRKNVVSMVQFDMNGYSQSGRRQIYFVSNGTSRSLTQQLGKLVDTYLDVPWTTQMLLFGSSDHASWNKRGFPAAFPTENPFAYNNHIHTAGDTLDKMNQPEQMGDFAKLGVAYFMEFAGN